MRVERTGCAAFALHSNRLCLLAKARVPIQDGRSTAVNNRRLSQILSPGKRKAILSQTKPYTYKFYADSERRFTPVLACIQY